MTKRDKVKNIFYGLIYAWNAISTMDKNRTVNKEIDKILEICEPKKINKELFETVKEELTKSLKVILPVAIEKEVRKRSKPRKLSKKKVLKIIAERLKYYMFSVPETNLLEGINEFIEQGKDVWEDN